MTEQEKQLLLIDICARLPYHLLGIDAFGKLREMKVIYPTGTIIAQEVNGESCAACEFKPYLRPMSSMTKSEIQDFKATTGVFTYYPGHKIYNHIPMFDNDNTPFSTFDDDKVFYQVKPEHVISCIDWLNSHHFDYRGLIEKGLALEAPEDMYNTKTE